jgi:hypothetical protein
MTSGRYAIRLDPWGAEYEGSIQIGEEDEAVPVDIRVEQAGWAAIRPAPAPPPRLVAFVDGVRRVEHRLLIADARADRTVFGLLGSFGVGGVRVDGRARVGDDAVGRVVVAGSGLVLDPFVAPVNGRGTLVFEPRSEPDDTPVAPVEGLQKAMRREEAALAERLSGEVEVVFLDGPLTFLAGARGSVVGFVKRLLRSYLDPSAHALLPRLEVGERTPLFLVAGKEPRYSWYQRIARGRAIESPLTGIVRLEARAARGLAESMALADLSARELPRFASTATHDARAPQNLFPIGGLEARLKHLLGDPAVVRRAIETRLHGEVAA